MQKFSFILVIRAQEFATNLKKDDCKVESWKTLKETTKLESSEEKKLIER